MSSYLNFYLIPKKEEGKEEKYIALTSYSRNTEIYQRFSELLNPAFIGTEGEIKYSYISREDIEDVLQDFDKDIQKAKARLSEYEKYAAGNCECINDIIEMKEYLEELQYWRAKASFIADIIEDIDLYNEDLEKMACNVD